MADLAQKLVGRRGLVAMLGLVAAAPKAVEAQAMEILRERLDEGMPDVQPPAGVCSGHCTLTLEQMALKPFVTEARRKERRKISAINRCRSMSQAAKQAYIRDAQREGETLFLKWSKAMGWMGPDADVSDLYG